MVKKISFLLAVLVLMSFAAYPASAAKTNEFDMSSQIQPRWINTSSVIMKLDVTESPILAGFTITGHMGTTYSNGTFVLEKISGSHTGVIQTWSNLSSDNYVYYMNDEVYTTLTAGQYRITLTITATNNGVSEEIELTKVSVR